MSIYILCGAVILAGFVLAWFIKREGERNWERHLIASHHAEFQASLRRVAKQMVEVRIVVRDQMTPALRVAAREINHMREALAKDGGRS